MSDDMLYRDPMPVLYVSSDLVLMHETVTEYLPAGTALACDISQKDTDKWRAYRRLDPMWYAWLSDRMRRAEQKHEAGEISAEAWSIMRARFSQVWRWCCEQWGNATTAEAATIIPAPNYCAPLLRPSIS